MSARPSSSPASTAATQRGARFEYVSPHAIRRARREGAARAPNARPRSRWRRVENAGRWRWVMAEQWRVACVRIPRFPIAAVWRTRSARTSLLHPLPSSPPTRTHPPRENPRQPSPPRKTPSHPQLHAVSAAPPSWDDELVALLSDGKLRAVSGAAARAGVRSGMTALEARARCSALEILDWSDTAIASAIAELSAHFLIASPQVTPAVHEPGLWWIGAHGFDAMGGERMLVRALAEIAGAWNPRARVAVASSCVAARAATWAAPGRRTSIEAAFIVPAGGDATVSY